MTFTFRTVDAHWDASQSYGYQTFVVEAATRRDAWDAVRKLTSHILICLNSAEDR
jgi:hypothetical protein